MNIALLLLESLIDELSSHPAHPQLTLPQPEEWQVKGATSTYHACSLIPVKANIDVFDMRIDATVITDAFPPGICRRTQKDIAKTSSSSNQPVKPALTIVRRSWYHSSFLMPQPLPLKRLIETGSWVSIFTFAAYNRLAVQIGATLWPYSFHLYAANGKTFETFQLAESI